MQEFKVLLNEWLNQWKECSICTDMLKLNDLNIILNIFILLLLLLINFY